MTDRPDLTDLLDRAVPDPPSLAGLAARAQADARRARTRRRTAVGAAALVLVAVATSLTVGSRTTPPTASDEVVPDPATAEPCRPGRPEAAKDAARDSSTDAAPVSVRFCGVDPDQPRGRRPPAVVPEVALTAGVAATVEALEDAVTTAARSFCVTERNPYRIQIAYEDGSVRNLPSEDCGRGYALLLEAIGQQNARTRNLPVLDVPQPPCPGTPVGRDRTVPRGMGLPDADDLASLNGMIATRCDYRDGLVAAVSVRDPEELRAALLSSYSTAMVDCEPRPELGATTWVLRLDDGSTHTATLNRRCGVTYLLDGRVVGLAGPLLAEYPG